jgi:dienelactone hydrolase
MASGAQSLRRAAVCIAAMAAAACGGDGDERGLTVTSEVVLAPGGQAVHVVAPEVGGNWPVVVMLHGVGGRGEDMVDLATRVAGGGVVVFAPTYHSELATVEDLVRAGDDLSCAYQLAWRTAADYGGDLSQPVTAVGWSLGADLALLGSLDESGDSGDGSCDTEVPLPEVVVGVAGCYFEFDGNPVTWFVDVTAWGNRDARIHLIDGERDAVCPPWQTDQLAGALSASGYEVDVVELDGANHYAPVFHDLQDGEWQVVTDDPAGERTAEIILEAVAAVRD